MAVHSLKITKYEKYRLSRLVCVNEIVSADYVQGDLPPSPHTHQDAWEMGCCISGQAAVCYGKRVIPLQTGEVFFVPPGVSHAFMIDEGGENAAFVISFTCADGPVKLLRSRTLQVTEAQKRIIDQTIRELMDAFSRSKPGLRIYHFEPNPDAPLGAEQMILCYLEQLLIGFLRAITMRKGVVITGTHFERSIGNYQIDTVRRYVREHLQEELSVEHLAREFHYSRTRLSVLFKEATGQTINEYITQERISRAKHLLVEGKLSMTQISRSVGYSSPHYFSRRFSQVVGCAPSDYLNRTSKISADETVGGDER